MAFIPAPTSAVSISAVKWPHIWAFHSGIRTELIILALLDYIIHLQCCKSAMTSYFSNSSSSSVSQFWTRCFRRSAAAGTAQCFSTSFVVNRSRLMGEKHCGSVFSKWTWWHVSCGKCRKTTPGITCSHFYVPLETRSLQRLQPCRHLNHFITFWKCLSALQARLVTNLSNGKSMVKLILANTWSDIICWVLISLNF